MSRAAIDLLVAISKGMAGISVLSALVVIYQFGMVEVIDSSHIIQTTTKVINWSLIFGASASAIYAVLFAAMFSAVRSILFYAQDSAEKG